MTGSGTLQISGGGVLDLGGAVNSGATIQFEGTGGKLNLNAPASFSGLFKGFGLGDTIDLAGIAATSASYSNTLGDLIVSDNGSTVASLPLVGEIPGTQFSVLSDGGSGSLVFPESSSRYIGEVTLAETFTDPSGAEISGRFRRSGGNHLFAFDERANTQG